MAIAAYLDERCADAIRAAYPDADVRDGVGGVTASAAGKAADFQCNSAFRLAKAAQTSPLEIARRLAESIHAAPMFASADVAPPGFVNFRFDPAWLQRQISLLSSGGVDPLEPVRDAPKVVIDFSSPNV